MGFTVILLQELITGEGVVQGLQEGKFLNIAFVGATVVSVLGISILLAVKGVDVPKFCATLHAKAPAAKTQQALRGAAQERDVQPHVHQKGARPRTSWCRRRCDG